MSSMGFLVQGAKVVPIVAIDTPRCKASYPHQQLRHCVSAGLTLNNSIKALPVRNASFCSADFHKSGSGGHQHRFQNLDINPVRITRHTAACQSQFPLPERRIWPP